MTRDTDAREVWALMSDLVLTNVRRREVTDTLGLSFARVRAVRRIARGPMSMSELARSLDIDPPNASTMVHDLESLGHVKREAHPEDGRVKLVRATRKGQALARRADEILSTPPRSVAELSAADLAQLRRILRQI